MHGEPMKSSDNTAKVYSNASVSGLFIHVTRPNDFQLEAFSRALDASEAE
jgi:hypothetical protein